MGLVDAMTRDGATGLWVLDEKTGTTARDQAGAKHGTYTGTYTLGAANAGFDPRPSLSLSAAGYVAIADDGLFSTHAGASGVLSLEAVITPTTVTGSDRFIFTKAQNPYEWSLSLDTTGHVLAYVWTNLGSTVMTATSAVIAASVPHHILYTYNRATPASTLYVDGVAVTNSTLVNGAVFSSDTSSTVAIGRRDDSVGTPVSGRVGPCAYYPTALTAAQAAAHYREFLRGGVQGGGYG